MLLIIAMVVRVGVVRGERSIPSISLEQLGLDVVKLGVPSVYSVWVGVDSEMLCTGELMKPEDGSNTSPPSPNDPDT